MQDAAVSIYHGVYGTTFKSKGSISQGILSNTYKFILNPLRGGTDLSLYGILIITINFNGVITAIVGQFTVWVLEKHTA